METKKKVGHIQYYFYSSDTEGLEDHELEGWQEDYIKMDQQEIAEQEAKKELEHGREHH